MAQALAQNVGALDRVLSFPEEPLAQLSWILYPSPVFQKLAALAETLHPPTTNMALVCILYAGCFFPVRTHYGKPGEKVGTELER